MKNLRITGVIVIFFFLVGMMNVSFGISLDKFKEVTNKSNLSLERVCFGIVKRTMRGEFNVSIPFSFRQFLNASEVKYGTISIHLLNFTPPQNVTWIIAGIGSDRPTTFFQKEYVVVLSYNPYGFEGCLAWNAEPVKSTSEKFSLQRLSTKYVNFLNGTSFYVRMSEKMMKSLVGEWYKIKAVTAYLTNNPAYREIYLFDRISAKRIRSEISSKNCYNTLLSLLSVLILCLIIAVIYLYRRCRKI